jgi:two-component system phosphate regulon response regulator PhoB
VSTILVVDDDPEVGRLLSIVLELEGHQVTLVADYQEVLPALRRDPPDVVVMDLRIQGRETTQLVRQMRREKELAHVPVVMASGTDCRERCVEAGADVFVLKPFAPNQLVEAVSGLLERSFGFE